MTTPDTEVLETGCIRQKTDGRGSYELLSPFVLERDAKLYEWGSRSEHRGNRNWETGCPFGRCIQSAMRHLVKYMMRESDEDHDDNLAAVRFWCAAIMHYEEMIKRGLLPKSLDDRPVYGKEGPLRIYVSGAITAPTEEEEHENCVKGDAVGLELEKLGHYVFVPHRWETRTVYPEGLGYENYMELDFSIIERWADTFFFMGSSPGANRELDLAKKLGLKIYTDVQDVPLYKELSDV